MKTFAQEFSSLLDTYVEEDPPLWGYHSGWLDTVLSEENIEKFLIFYYSLADDQSRNTLLQLINATIACNFSRDSEKRRFTNVDINALYAEVSQVDCFQDPFIPEVIQIFLLQGYSYNGVCEIKPGDCVIDCGAYTGNSALYFSKFLNGHGKVYAMEAMPETFLKLNNNIKSRKLESIVSCHQLAVNDKDEIIYFTDIANMMSRKADVKTGVPVKAVRIDSFVCEQQVERVDLIKMDIEGGELAALSGATETIKRYRPVLAVSIYHKYDDMLTIPAVIKDICPEYNFYLKHSWIGPQETVLFATCALPALPPSNNYASSGTEGVFVAKLWKTGIKIMEERQKKERKLLLELYSARLEPHLPVPLECRIDNNGYYLAYPLSQGLHYEFWFIDNALQVSLHFEEALSKKSETIEVCWEIIAKSEAQTQLILVDRSTIKGCAYICNDYENTRLVANLMAYLIKISWPILQKYKLIDDPLLIKASK